MKNLITALMLFVSIGVFAQQKVGVVLSGGGASGVAHVGVLKALEESGVQIDYITGTSSGALVGALYAVGYSPDEIEAFITSEELNILARGGIDEVNPYYFMKKEKDASWVTLNFTLNDLLNSTLPTNLVKPSGIDMALFKYMSQASAASGYNFDSLMVPFRCVASDIESKEEVIFCGGNLSTAVRASITYPFYLKPISVNGKLLFDGGLYNNFPIDIMHSDFNPDYIIGSNVSSNEPPPEQDNLISQVKNMMVRKSIFSLESPGVIIEPKTDQGLFEFDHLQEVIDSGYTATMRQMPEILSELSLADSKVVKERRIQFKEKLAEDMVFKELAVSGVNNRQKEYIKDVLQKRRNTEQSAELFEKQFYRLVQDNKIEWVYPSAVRFSSDKPYNLELQVKKKKPFALSFGGNFSTRPINTGFVGIESVYLGRTGLTAYGNTYFGKLYGSILGGVRWDVPTRVPFSVTLEGTRNRWNYFQSQTSFLNDQTPTYLIQKENYLRLAFGLPVGNKGKFHVGWHTGNTVDEYYQSINFTSADIPDETSFSFQRFLTQLEHNTLDEKLYPSKGSLYRIEASYIQGQEFYQPGSTSNQSLNDENSLSWFQVSGKFEQYFNRRGRFRLGLNIEAAASTQEPFNNYTANLLKLPFFQPNPESKTLFLESYRSAVFVAGGPKLIIQLSDRFDWRLQGALFQPIENYTANTDQTVTVTRGLRNLYSTASSALVFKSPLGPLSLSANYYYNVPEIIPDLNFPITVFFHFGYVIFNKRAIHSMD